MRLVVAVVLISAFCFFPQAWAQTGNSGKIGVRVVDDKEQGLEGVLVLLSRANDSVLVASAMTETDGRTEFSGLSSNVYRIRTEKTGWGSYNSDTLRLDSLHAYRILPPVHLQVNSLQEVVVTAQTPFIEKLSDRLVVNVAASPLHTGSSVWDVLLRSPGIRADQNDNLSMKGKANVLVMFDGKVTPLSGSDLANLLRGMPAASVEKIELITNPPAQYDAAGNAGIIQIKLNKDKRLGTNGSLMAGYGQGVYPQTNEGFSLNHRTDKYNVFCNYNYSYRSGLNHLTLTREFSQGDVFTGAYKQDYYLVIPISTHTARAGVDFFVSDKTTLGCTFSGMDSHYFPHGENISDVYDSLWHKQGYFSTSNHSDNSSINYSANLNLKHTFDTTGREITADLDYARYSIGSLQNFLTNYYRSDNTLSGNPDILKGDLQSNLFIYAVKADYTMPWLKSARLMAGFKSSLVHADSDLKFYTVQNNVSQLDSGKSNHFVYDENINAAYLQLQGGQDKSKWQGGVRAEETRTAGVQLATGQSFHLDNLQLFPSFSFSRKFSENQEFALSVSRRIDRPTYGQLDPFRFYLDPSTYKEGNPYLLSQYTWSLELSDVIKDKYIVSLNYSNTQNVITTVLIPSPTEQHVTIQIDENLNRFDYYGLSMSLPFTPFKWFNSVNNLNFYYGHYNANLAQTILNSGQFAWDLNSTNSFSLGKKLYADLGFVYNSSVLFGYLVMKPTWELSAGIQRKILKGKAQVKAGITDMFWTGLSKGSTVLTNYAESFSVTRETRVASVSFTYNFGSGAAGPRRKAGGAEEEKRRAAAGTG